MNLNKQTEQTSDNGGQLPSNAKSQVSQVLQVEPLQGEEKIITIEIPLNDGTTVLAKGTLGDIIQLRKKLELEGKIPPIIAHDEQAQLSLLEVQEKQRWYYGPQQGNIVDYRKKYEEKQQSEKRQKELMQHIIQPLLDGKAYIVKGTKKTKDVLVEVLIVSDKTIDTLSKKDTWIKTGKTVMSKETWIKTGKTLMDVVDQGVNTTFPGVLETLPHMRKQIVMTSKEIMNLIQSHTKNIIKKKERKSSNTTE